MRRTKTWTGVLLVVLGLVPLRAEIVLQDDFEGPDGTCRPNWNYSEQFRIAIDDTRPHGGRCAASYRYAFDEDRAHLWTRGPSSPSKVIHGIYWEYIETSGNWPRHLKRNRIFTQGGPHLGVLHPFSNAGNFQTYYNRDSVGLECTFHRAGDPPAHAGRWRKVEFYAEMRDGGSQSSCPGNDIFRVWVDDQLHMDETEWVIGNGDSDGFEDFWLFGNASDGSYPITVYMDDICIDTDCECGGLACGGGGTDPPPELPAPQNLDRTDKHP